MSSQSDRTGQRSILLRVMHPRGIYPADDLHHRDAVFISDPQYVISVTRVDASDGVLSELQWASVAEIHLWAAVTLSIPEGSGIYHVYPTNWARYIDPLELPSLDLSDEHCVQEFCNIGSELTVDRLSAGLLGSYMRRENDGGSIARQKLYRALSARNPLIMRGANCLLKGWMLWSHDVFGEEAALSIFIAMEAALDYLRLSLSEQQQKELGFNDVHDHLTRTIHLGEPLSQYLRLCWENRIKLAHPNSKHGCWSIPPLVADDFYETYEALVTLYRFILLGEDRPRLLD